MKRRIAVNLGLVLVFTLLAILLYNSGKGYDLLLDNQKVDLGGVIYQPDGIVLVYIDDQEPLELWIGDRDISSVKGKQHTIKVELLDENEKDVIKTVQKEFVVDPDKGTLFSMPVLLSGAADWVIPHK